MEYQIILSVLSEEDMERIGEVTDETFLGFVNFLQSVPNIRMALFMRQDGEYIKGSLRSEADKNFNVSKLAHFFGGGGHVLASGFRVKGTIVKTNNGWNIQ
jgi:phosphoesterase RecJ-like protein